MSRNEKLKMSAPRFYDVLIRWAVSGITFTLSLVEHNKHAYEFQLHALVLSLDFDQAAKELQDIAPTRW